MQGSFFYAQNMWLLFVGYIQKWLYHRTRKEVIAMMFPYNAQNAQNQPFDYGAVKESIEALKMARNPFQLLTAMMQNNPNLRNVMQMCNGRNPQDVFYEECEKRGVNPQDILDLLR